MKLTIDEQDIEAIARKVVELTKPCNCNSKPDNEIFDVPELASYLKVNNTWVYKQVQLRTIPFFKSGRYIRFKKSLIDQWIQENTRHTISQWPS
jgi:excisionase family DNA binding protein